MNQQAIDQAFEKVAGDCSPEALESHLRALLTKVRGEAKRLFTEGYRAGYEAASQDPFGGN